MVYKTVQVSVAQPDSFASYLFGEMFANTWQSHFNVDLFLHTLLFTCWVFYREKHSAMALLYGIFSVATGAVFTFLYVIVIAYLSKGNLILIMNGHKNK